MSEKHKGVVAPKKIKVKDKRLAKLSLFFYDRPKLSVFIWIAILAFGIASYTTLLKRQGFPTINIPYSSVSGSYIVNDPAKVDNDIAKPLSKIITKQPKVKTVDVQSGKNFYMVAIQYNEGTDAKVASTNIEKAVKSANVLPKTATSEFRTLSPGIDQQGHDILVAFYSKNNNLLTSETYSHATQAVNYLKKIAKIPLAGSIEAVDPYARGIDPATGQPAAVQQIFDRYIIKNGTSPAQQYKSVVIGIKGASGFDVLALDKQVRSSIDKFNKSALADGYFAKVSYSPAPDINDQISNLQSSLLDALAAILVISALLIAFRAAIITVSAMVLVLMTTLGVLYLIGYSLNTITLFSLILCLSLIVDDTIIMVEAIDAERRQNKNARETIRTATNKISRAMMAATLTATVGFAPLLFVSGILGSFVKAIPVTVITSLVVSLLVALSFIPFFSRFLLLRKKQLGQGARRESAAHRIEGSIARFLSRPLLWSKHSRRRQFSLGITAIIIGFGFIFAGGFLFQKVTFDIFPADKDGDIIGIQMVFDPNLSITQTQQVADQADKIVTGSLGSNFKSASYYNTGSTQGATLTVVLRSFKQRSITAPQISKQLETAFNGFAGAHVKVSAQGAGPPASAFNVYIETDNRIAAGAAANDLAQFLRQKELVRANGTKAHFKSITISNSDTYSRNNGKAYIAVSGEFDGSDTTTLITLAQNAIKNNFNSKMPYYGLKASNLTFNIGTQEDFQNSFKNLALAFPILLVVIFIFLALQFRSLLQPLLIFMAIPFSFFGITAGLWLTHNAFSFFTLLGFFALLGLSIKNTILLTDYANQARRAGASHVDSVVISLQERFRPLIATSLTAVISLIPLYLSNPFWEGLTVTLMFGLLSSTFLVVTVFPYYYLGAEYLRMKISRRMFFSWVIVNAIVLVVATMTIGAAAYLAILVLNLLIILGKFAKHKSHRKNNSPSG